MDLFGHRSCYERHCIVTGLIDLREQGEQTGNTNGTKIKKRVANGETGDTHKASRQCGQVETQYRSQETLRQASAKAYTTTQRNRRFPPTERFGTNTTLLIGLRYPGLK